MPTRRDIFCSGALNACAARFLALATVVCVLGACAAVGAAQAEERVVQPGEYAEVNAQQPLRFPRDHGAHPAYRTEWWYITGWTTDEQGIERGVQITFFRVRTLIGENNPSRFAPTQLIFAHAAIADPAEGRLLHAERVGRALPPLAGADTAHTNVWVDDWHLRWQPAAEAGGEREENEADGAGGAYTALAHAADFGFALRFVPSGDPVRNGRAGFSQKTDDPRNASHYYSRPQLAIDGSLQLRGKTLRVTGRAWLDHEWSSEILPPHASGWDWVGINLDDGGALMAFQMRDRQGRPIWHAATLRRGNGAPDVLPPEQVKFTPLRHWRSPRTGVAYPVAWALAIGERRFTLEPLIDDQELDSRGSTGSVYWEGAVRLREHGVQRGQGYLEMTGYLERLKM